ncbi:MAG: ABC transporter substrate-binding protein [Chloroflexi bacterium]|nr:ABC transporter substrate-binding protein [Chloroflexota bacterium]
MGRKRSSFAFLALGTLAVVALVAMACTREVEVEKVVKETVVVEKPVEKTIEKTVVVEKEKTVVVEKPVEKIVEKEKTVEKTVVVVQTATPLPATPTPTPKPKAAVNWKIGMPADVTSTNFWNILGPASTAYNFYAFLNMYPAPMVLSDQRFDYVPLVAADFPSDLKQEGDFWTTTVKFQKGIKWSDGTEVTAHDFVFTIQTALEFQLTGNWTSNVDPEIVSKAEATDDYTVKITFKKKPGLAQWQFGLAQQLFAQKKYWEPKVAAARATAGTIEDKRKALYTADNAGEPTAGEMVFKKWEKGAFVQLEKNKNYFWSGSKVKEYAKGGYEETTKAGTFKTGDTTGDVKLQVERGPFADSVTYNVYGSQDAAVLAVRGADIEYFLSPLGLSAGLRSQVTGKPGIATFQNPSNGFRYLGFNTRRAPMDDKAFRQAVAILIDKVFLTRDILQNTAEPIDTVVPVGNGFWHNPGVKKFGTTADGKNMTREQRITEVVALLKANGYTWDKEPKWNAADRRVEAGSGLKKAGVAVKEMELLSPSAGYDPLRATSAIWIEQWLKEAGIPIKANLTGFNPIVDLVFTQQNFDMWILGWGLTIYPDYVADFFHSKQAIKEGQNAGGYNNPAFDKAADEFLAETDLNKAKEKALKLQETIADELPYVTLFAVPILEVYRPDKVKFAYTDVLDGVQNYFQGINGPLATTKFE